MVTMLTMVTSVTSVTMVTSLTSVTMVTMLMKDDYVYLPCMVSRYLVATWTQVLACNMNRLED